MLVILMEEQVLSPSQVCRNCLLATQNGQPRWSHGKLGCGHALRKLTPQQPDQYECEMGFRVANVE
ncbi:MAG TPA: hypothetical protein DCL61_00290 [Cyanobacteria bacterium UBA12227]|nr:hypothetical protein [Cyanobacteria bacterium UBA12227]